jgi:hypothetical protein
MRKITLAVLALSAAITTQARADYLWQFVPTRVTAMNVDYSTGFGYVPVPGISSNEAKSWLPTFDLTITNSAFRSRALSLSWSECLQAGPCLNPPTGDFSEVVSFSGVDSVDPSYLYGSGLVDMAWNRNGKMTGDVELYGMLTDLVLQWTGVGQKWEGWYASDGSECGMTVTRCAITGHWAFLGDPPGAPIPEPASIAMLAFGLLGAGAARKLV